MIVLAFLIIPVLALQFFYPLTKTQGLIITIIDWIIWFAFFFEFVLKTSVEKDKLGYVKRNKLDSSISIIIILSPLLELLAPFLGGAAILRLLRLSRLVRFVGIAGKTRMKWRRINFKSYLIVVLIIAVGFLIALFKPAIKYSANDVTWLTVFVSIAGVIYAVIAAFTIIHVWSEFNYLDSEMKKEVTHLRNTVLLADQISQKVFGKKLRQHILNYIRSNVDRFWRKITSVEENRNKFIEVIESTKNFRPKNQKDNIILNNVIEELRATSAARTNITTLAHSKTPNIVWFLLVYLSFMLIIGISLMDIQNKLLSILVITMTSTAVALVTVLVYDMDFPFQAGFWVITPEPYFELEDFIKKGRY